MRVVSGASGGPQKWTWIVIGIIVGALVAGLWAKHRQSNSGLERTGKQLDRTLRDMDRELDKAFPQKRQ